MGIYCRSENRYMLIMNESPERYSNQLSPSHIVISFTLQSLKNEETRLRQNISRCNKERIILKEYITQLTARIFQLARDLERSRTSIERVEIQWIANCTAF